MRDWLWEDEIYNVWGKGGSITEGCRFLFYKHLAIGIYNDMDEKDESPGLWFFPTQSSVACGWLFNLLFLFDPQRKYCKIKTVW